MSGQDVQAKKGEKSDTFYSDPGETESTLLDDCRERGSWMAYVDGTTVRNEYFDILLKT